MIVFVRKMKIKSFCSLIGRHPNWLHRFYITSRCHNALFLTERFQILSYTPLLIQNCISSRHLSHVANQEKALKDNQNAIEVPPLQFEETSFDQPVTHEDLIAALQNHDTLINQMECLEKTLSLSPGDIKKRVKFCKTVELLFRPFFEDFKIQMFGSTVNSFGFKGCDIDMTFETRAKPKDMSCYLERPDVPLVSEVLSGKVSRQELSELPHREQLLFIHSIFLEYYKDSEVPAKFINAHVPLVRFYHDKYNLKCDLTMKNRVAYANTKLLYLFAKLDERITPLMMTIRYWAKHVELIGKGLMFNTYTISLLVIYFLQTRKPPILPSAEYILSLSDKFEIDDMADRSFLDVLKCIPKTKNNQTLDELFKEFFYFYLYFDFTKVVRPLTASADSREDFFSKQENRRFRMNSLCIQDPLCLSHNVAELVDYKHCKKFFTELMVICKLFQNEAISHNVNLLTILNKPKELSVRKVFDEKVISFCLPLVSKREQQLSGNSVLHSARILLHILQDVLLFNCKKLNLSQIELLLKKQDELVEEQKAQWFDLKRLKQIQEELIPHLKNRRLKYGTDSKENSEATELDEEPLLQQFQNFNSTHKFILGCECQVFNNTWLGRDLVDISTISTDDILLQEQSISIHVSKQNALNYSEQKIKPFFFLFECYSSHENSELLIVNFRPLRRMSFNPILGIFLKEYIPKILNKINSSV